jgi:hypothetical protein
MQTLDHKISTKPSEWTKWKEEQDQPPENSTYSLDTVGTMYYTKLAEIETAILNQAAPRTINYKQKEKNRRHRREVKKQKQKMRRS